jgi:hypothetical protein
MLEPEAGIVRPSIQQVAGLGLPEIRRGLGPQAGDLAGDDGLHDLGGAAVNSRLAKGSYDGNQEVAGERHFCVR